MKNKGFTILELMITIVVVSIGILGAYSVIQDIFSSTSKVSYSLTATYLAQEGIELVRNGRDTNWIGGAINWYDGLIVDPLVTSPVSGFPGYSRGTNVFLSGSKLVVKVNVTWNIRGDTGTINIEEELYDWR